MRFIKRLMEIKEEQLKMTYHTYNFECHAQNTLDEILKVLKGGAKDGNNKNRRNR